MIKQIVIFLGSIVTVFAGLCGNPQTSTFACPDSSTCCRGPGGWRCCPGINSTCCSDGSSCCPSNTICDLARRQCKAKTLAFLSDEAEVVPIQVNELK